MTLWPLINNHDLLYHTFQHIFSWLSQKPCHYVFHSQIFPWKDQYLPFLRFLPTLVRLMDDSITLINILYLLYCIYQHIFWQLSQNPHHFLSQCLIFPLKMDFCHFRHFLPNLVIPSFSVLSLHLNFSFLMHLYNFRSNMHPLECPVPIKTALRS